MNITKDHPECVVLSMFVVNKKAVAGGEKLHSRCECRDDMRDDRPDPD